MDEKARILLRVRKASGKRRLFLAHALRQMHRPERMITTAEVRQVVEHGEVIEDYPDDARGHSCLLLGRGNSDRPSEEKTMKCLHCQGEMKKGMTPLHIDRKGCHLTLDSIPAWVCSQCGEPYFEEAEVDAIQDLIRSIEQKAQALAMTV